MLLQLGVSRFESRETAAALDAFDRAAALGALSDDAVDMIESVRFVDARATILADPSLAINGSEVLGPGMDNFRYGNYTFTVRAFEQESDGTRNAIDAFHFSAPIRITVFYDVSKLLAGSDAPVGDAPVGGPAGDSPAGGPLPPLLEVPARLR